MINNNMWSIPIENKIIGLRFIVNVMIVFIFKYRICYFIVSMAFNFDEIQMSNERSQ